MQCYRYNKLSKCRALPKSPQLKASGPARLYPHGSVPSSFKSKFFNLDHGAMQEIVIARVSHSICLKSLE